MIKLEMKNCNAIFTEKQQIKSALLLGRIDKYEYLTGEGISLDQNRVIEHAKFTYTPLGKAFEKKK